jgi:hypothetical protein
MRLFACGESEVVRLTRPTGATARQQISVQELIQRVRAENSPPAAADRVRVAAAPEKGRAQPDGFTRWLVAGAGLVTALSAFALVSFAVSDDPERVPATQPGHLPAVSVPITFAGTRTVTETVEPPLSAIDPTFYQPYGSPYASYYAPAK